MEESVLKTSWKQRLVIIIVAIILLGSSIAVYVAVIVGGGGTSSSTTTTETEINDIIAEYTAKQSEIAAAMPSSYYDAMSGYLSKVAAFNATSANENGVQYEDLVVGDGAEITANDSSYYAYYIGWCADETIFDSSFDSNDSPTALNAPLAVSGTDMIEGWTTGMTGAKIGGVRLLTIPGELAYGDNLEICGGYNSPLKFIVMTLDLPESIQSLYAELDQIYQRYVEATYKYYGVGAEPAARNIG